jgi:hypothetical protein
MQVKIPYKNLTYTLQCLKLQAIDSLPYISKFIPSDIATPEDLFYFLKSVTKYKKDPSGVELIRTIQTLMKEGGRGDCDCFTVAVLASCYYLGFEPQQVVIAGDSKFSPSHIYSLVYDPERKKMCSMDLTNPDYDTQRSYRYKQILDFSMMLELRDDGLANRSTRHAKKTIRQSGKIARTTSVTGRRTTRTTNKGVRKGTKQTTKINRQRGGLLKVTGKQDILNQRQQQAASSSVFSPDADMVPDNSQTPGGNYQASTDTDGDYTNQGGSYDPYEMMPDDSQFEDGIISKVITGAGKLLKTASSGATTAVSQYQQMVNENNNLKYQIQQQKQNSVIYAGAGAAGGMAIGFLLSKAFK